MNGAVESVTTDWRGDTLAVAVASGDSVLTVGDTSDFDEELGGWLTIADATPIAYTTVDHDANTVTLAGTAGAAYEIGDPVVVWDPSSGAKVVEYVASVVTDRGPVEAILPHEMIPTAGVDALVGASVTLVEVDDDEWYVGEVPGREPLLDLTYADPTTVPTGQAFSLDAPTATDGFPEGYGWWQVDADNKVLGFWRLEGGAWVPQAILTVEALQANNILTTALDGETLTGTNIQTSATPDQGIHLDADGLRAYGPNGGSPFLDVNPSKGLVIVAGEGTFDKLTTPGDLGTGETSAELGGITQIKSGGTLTLVGGALPPAKAPAVGYTYDTIQFTNDGKWGDRYGLTHDGTNWWTTRMVSPGTNRLEKWSPAGALISYITFFADEMAGIVASGGLLYILYKANAMWSVFRMDPTTMTGILNYWNHSDSARTPAIGFDSASGDILIAQCRPSNADKVRVRRYTMSSTTGDPLVAGTFEDSSFAYFQHLAGVTYGTHDFGANRYVFTARSGDETFRVMDTTGAAVTAEDWQAPAQRVGFAYQGGAFKTIDQTGVMRTFTDFEKTTSIGSANLKKWVSSTNFRASRPVTLTTTSGSNVFETPLGAGLATGTTPAGDVGAPVSGTGIPAGATIATVTPTGGTFSVNATATSPGIGITATITRALETPQSPRASIDIFKRSKLTVTAAGLLTSPTANDPNQVQIYVGQGTSSPSRTNMWLQTTPAVGVFTATYTSLVTSGTNPPLTNNFPNAVPSIMQATTNGFTVDANSNGSVGTGTFRDSVRSAVLGDYAAGAWTAYTPTFTATTTNPTLANFTRSGRYTQRGKTVTATIVITCNAASGFGTGTYEFGLPVAARAADEVVGQGMQTGPNQPYILRGSSTTTLFAIHTDTRGGMTATSSAMASGTVVRLSVTYEAA